MDGVTTVGAVAGLAGESSTKSKTDFSDLWNAVSTGAGTVDPTAGGISGTTQPPVRTSLLVSIQNMKASNSSAADDGTGDAEGGTAAGANSALAEKKAQEKAALDKTIEEIKEKGLVEWAHEKWLERIRAKARQKALAHLGLTEDDVASMSSDEQQRIEQLIKQVVEEAVRQAAEEASGGKTGKHPGQAGGKQASHAEGEASNQAKVLSPIITGA